MGEMSARDGMCQYGDVKVLEEGLIDGAGRKMVSRRAKTQEEGRRRKVVYVLETSSKSRRRTRTMESEGTVLSIIRSRMLCQWI